LSTQHQQADDINALADVRFLNVPEIRPLPKEFVKENK
jgi:hypothetical protein